MHMYRPLYVADCYMSSRYGHWAHIGVDWLGCYNIPCLEIYLPNIIYYIFKDSNKQQIVTNLRY